MPAQGGEMMHSSTTDRSARTESNPSSAHRLRWRVVDIVVASVLGVATGLVFLLWNIAYIGPSALLTPLLPGLQGLLNGPWLLAGVLGALVVRKPGAAVYTEVVAAIVSALVGNQWGGFLTVEAGLVQGIGVELVVALFLYRRFDLPVALLAGAAAGLFGACNDLILWYPGSAPGFAVTYLITSAISGAVLAGLLGWLITKGLARTGALDRFAAGREARGRV
jgi:energy-coupling factor transport system substrate-specific component